MNKLSAPHFYLVGQAASSLVGAMAWVVLPVYYVLTVHMNPLQLVLLGTIFELTIFLFGVPTGVAADVYGRRLSVTVGWALLGCALLLQGLVPLVTVIVVAQVVDGLGESCVDGAWAAWLADEVGEERFGPLLTRGAQVGQLGAFFGMIGGALLAAVHLQLPIVLAGALSLGLTVFSIAAMPERTPQHAPRESAPSWSVMAETLRESGRAVRKSALMLAILSIAAIFGAFSEGIDRLGEAHFLLDIGLPPFAGLKPVVWFGVIGAVGLVLGAVAMELPRRRMNLQSHRSVNRALLVANGSIIVSVLIFALAPNFALALLGYWAWSALRSVSGLLSTVWLNRSIPSPRVRATVLSMSGQANALGEWAGGPVLGVIGTVFSIRAALAVGAVTLVPALGLYSWALGRGEEPSMSAASLADPASGE